MKLAKDDLEAFVTAVLAVNRYSLEKAYDLLPALRKAGLTQPDKVAAMGIETLITGLFQAGYQRGGLMDMMAGRYLALMQFISKGKLDPLSGLVKRGDTDGAIELLCKVKGIGPSVATTAIELMKSVPS